MMRTKEEVQEQPRKYWLVEITSTDGEGLQFYVSAKDYYEAYVKADDYAKLVESQQLWDCYKGKGFTLLP